MYLQPKSYSVDTIALTLITRTYAKAKLTDFFLACFALKFEEKCPQYYSLIGKWNKPTCKGCFAHTGFTWACLCLRCLMLQDYICAAMCFSIHSGVLTVQRNVLLPPVVFSVLRKLPNCISIGSSTGRICYVIKPN